MIAGLTMYWSRFMKFIGAVQERLRPVKLSLIIIVVFFVGFALGNLHNFSLAQSDTAPPPQAAKAFEPFWQVYNLIQNSYLDRDNVQSSKMVDGAIKGMVDSLGDQFSGYMDPQTYPLLNDDLSGEVEGIGAVVETVQDTKQVRIVNVVEGSPAESAGLKSGDIFVKVDGEDITKLDQLDLVTKVRGPEGTKVTLTMQRGEETLDFTITRARIQIPTVEFKKINNLGYIKLRDFSVNAYSQLSDALKKLDVNHLDGLIFDMRGNPGGLLTSAIDIASTFIKDGTVLIEDFGNGNEQTYNTNGKYIGSAIPMAVLVDNNSASAAELVAGALQDRGRATIIGVTTFGKGTVQTWQSLINGGGVRLTIARWLTPARHWIHEKGITPDIVVEWPQDNRDPNNDPQLNAAIKFLTSNTGQSGTIATGTN
jgi:carboxyl-terminal processing protease